MNRVLVLLVMFAFGATARAADLDDAIAAVKSAGTDGASCKGLATKLKLATEALEDAKKSPARLPPAKGRVEVAKDFASTSCPDAVKAQVTDELGAALAAIAKAAEPKKAAKTGLDFGAACRANDACASDHCFVGASGDGYCSKLCTTASDCPAKWQCRRPGSAPETICIK